MQTGLQNKEIPAGPVGTIIEQLAKSVLQISGWPKP
jgi:hypothetical protein